MPEESRRALKGLDPRNPLVIDTRELGRRPGSMRELSRAVQAPAQLGVEIIGVPEGAVLQLDIRLESVVEGVLVTGTVTAQAAGECVRCLDPLERELHASFQELYVYPESDGTDDDEATRLEGDLIDLEPVVRDAVVLALPLAPVCWDDCRGLCPECGVRLDADPEHRHEAVDPRWAALAGFRSELDQDEERQES
ncbi:MAG TPA: YceD family protein [Actinomycetes bacterium]|nr:YceD family protein [Actinomycetes bacterium]